MKLLILAAGYATRLWPLTLNSPKPLLPIGTKPMIEHIIYKALSIKSIDEAYIVTNSKFARNFREWKKDSRIRLRFSVIDNGIDSLNERRGSIGDTIFAVEKKRIRSGLLVIAGDNIFDFSIGDFIRQAKKNSPYATTGLFDVKDLRLAKKYGIVKLNKRSVITSFDEKPKRPKSTLAAMCLYYFPREKLSQLMRYRDEGNSLDLAGTFIKWLSQRDKVYGYVFQGRWLDIGDKKSLKEAQVIDWNT